MENPEGKSIISTLVLVPIAWKVKSIPAEFEHKNVKETEQNAAKHIVQHANGSAGSDKSPKYVQRSEFSILKKTKKRIRW